LNFEKTQRRLFQPWWRYASEDSFEWIKLLAVKSPQAIQAFPGEALDIGTQISPAVPSEFLIQSNDCFQTLSFEQSLFCLRFIIEQK
jgi:hypothetical protein